MRINGNPTCGPLGALIQTILLIDDDANILQTLSRILKGRGYDVISASNCKQAEEQFVGNVVTW